MFYLICYSYGILQQLLQIGHNHRVKLCQIDIDFSDDPVYALPMVTQSP